MYTYTNGKTTITTACKISGGGWEPVSKVIESKQNTRSEDDKETKTTAKRKKNE
jgi:hypothetical protein